MMENNLIPNTATHVCNHPVAHPLDLVEIGLYEIVFSDYEEGPTSYLFYSASGMSTENFSKLCESIMEELAKSDDVVTGRDKRFGPFVMWSTMLDRLCSVLVKDHGFRRVISKRLFEIRASDWQRARAEEK